MNRYDMNRRAQNARQLLQLPDCVSKIDSDHFRIRSQNDPDKHYIVSKTGNLLICECQDHQENGSDCKHIKVVLDTLKSNKTQDPEPFRMVYRTEIKICKYCDSGDIKKNGVRVKKSSTTQRYKCRECGKRFSGNFGFERMRYDQSTITMAMQMSFSGMSLRDIADCLEQHGVSITNRGIYGWLAKYSAMTAKYLRSITPRVSEKWRTDEINLWISGNRQWLYAMMDDSTRYLIATQVSARKFTESVTPMFMQATTVANMIPETLISDGARNFHDAWKQLWRQRNFLHKMTSHIRHVHLQGDMNNNKMERLNGTIRDWEQILRGIKKVDSPLFEGFMVFYNCSKKHGGLGGKTPAEEALIHILGENKWLTLIQNASLYAEQN